MSENPLADAETLLGALLEGAGYSGFAFESAFTLRFERCEPGVLHGEPLPLFMELRLDTDWWFEELQFWREFAGTRGKAKDPSLGDQSKAALLTELRWEDGAQIVRAELNPNALQLTFANGTKIIVPASLSGTWALTELIDGAAIGRNYVESDSGDVYAEVMRSQRPSVRAS